MSQGFTSPYRENITDARVLNLVEFNSQKKRASWTVRYAGNKVRIVVWTGIENDVDGGKMQVILEPEAWFGFMSLLEHVIHHGKAGEVFYMESLGLGKEGWKKGPVPRGDLYIGRDNQGVIFFSLVQPNRPKQMFPLKEDAFYNFKLKDGTPLSREMASNLVANSYLNRGRQIISVLSATEYVAKDDKPNPGRGKSNNYSSNNNNSFDTPQTQSSFDTSEASSGSDDFDF